MDNKLSIITEYELEAIRNIGPVLREGGRLELMTYNHLHTGGSHVLRYRKSHVCMVNSRGPRKEPMLHHPSKVRRKKQMKFSEMEQSKKWEENKNLILLRIIQTLNNKRLRGEWV